MIYSYSSLATFKQCPAKFNYHYKLKVEVPEQPPSPALVRGSSVHDSVENFLNRKTEILHPDIHKNYGQFLFSIREGDDELHPEFKWGISWEFEPCEYDAPNCMIHGFIDLLSVPKDTSENLTNYEWKTGKVYKEAHRHQALIYATAMLVHYPEHPGVDAMITYFDQVDYDRVRYTSTMLFEYKPMLRSEIAKVADETRFPPMPSFRCKWCQFSRHNGGPCQF